MHLTVRMAWHDNNWDGKICQNPEANTYCTGAHSLLSGRIEKKKDVEFEQANKGQAVSKCCDLGSVPPCYWSINAFSSDSFKVEHTHAFSWVTHRIMDKVKPNSVFTWPFKLSFVHNPKNQKVHGNYPPDLDKKIKGVKQKVPFKKSPKKPEKPI